MHEYDIALKLALQSPAELVVRTLTGSRIDKWHNVELPKVRNARVDLLGETADGALIYIELQSRNDTKMPLRMAEYCLSVYRCFNKFPHQILLYVGEEPLRMASELIGLELSFRYQVVDIRELGGDRLLESDQVGDNVIAILARLRDRQAAVRKIVTRIAVLAHEEREAALDQLLILAGLRHLENLVEQEITKMPITEDIRNHAVIGREYRRGVEEGVQQGELTVLRRLIDKRFGAIPDWAEERLANLPTKELEELSVRVLDAQTLEELLK